MSEREVIILDKKIALELINGSKDDQFTVIDNTICDHGSWIISYKVILKRNADNKYFRGYYRVGATEHQEEVPWEYEKPEFIEVFLIEKTITVYE